MNKWILLKTSKVECNDSYNIVEMKFLHDTEKKQNQYYISFKIDIKYDNAEGILDEFNSNLGDVENKGDFISAINVYRNKYPRWISVSNIRNN